MSEEKITTSAEQSLENLESIAGGKSKRKKATKTQYKCHQCELGTHLSGADFSSYIYKAEGTEGYCHNGHHWLVVPSIYDKYDPTGAKAWFVAHK